MTFRFRFSPLDSHHPGNAGPPVSRLWSPASLLPIAGTRSTSEACERIMLVISMTRPVIL